MGFLPILQKLYISDFRLMIQELQAKEKEEYEYWIKKNESTRAVDFVVG